MLNDAQEGCWGYGVFEEAATRLLNRTGIPDTIPSLPKSFFDSVDEVLSNIQLIAHPFVACFSADADDLGQWRAYADDGRGFAIGFRSENLKQLPVSVLSVAYDLEQQIKEMMAALVAIFMRHGTVDHKEHLLDCALTATYMCAFKHSAFKAEKEVRCLHILNVKREGDDYKFVDPGGQNDNGHAFEPVPVGFQVRGNHLCAYLDLPFWSQEGEHPIAEIVLGPKNESHYGNVFLYLGAVGYKGVGLRSSQIPYR